MIVSLNDYPPYTYLFQVLEHCPRAGSIYMQLWKKRNKENRVVTYKEDIRNEFFMSPYKFKNELLLLCKEGLVSIDERPNTLEIELVDFDPHYNEKGE